MATSTRPSPRTRKAVPAKVAPAAETVSETAQPDTTEEETTEAYTFDLEPRDDTKTYSKWEPPKSSGCVGTIYAPKGTTRVRVRIAGTSK